jgi:methylthioribulose-1-phosphate dehydratase
MKERRARAPRAADRFAALAAELVELGRELERRRWVLATSGNLSAVVDRSPLSLAVTPSGVGVGFLTADRFLRVDGAGALLDGSGTPSAETPLHLEVIRSRGAGAVVHTHSLWSTLASESRDGVELAGFEMLKGLAGVRSHEHREWLPMVENSQDMAALAAAVGQTLAAHPDCHGFLVRRHGLYTWGADLAEARRHLEVLEFLLEVTGRERGER